MSLRGSDASKPRIPVFEHALPHRIFLEEMEAQNCSTVELEKIVDDVEAAYKALDKAKDAADDWGSQHIGLPPIGGDLEKLQNSVLEDFRAAEKKCKDCQQKFTAALHHAKRSALCFSGGGIRSASICLGVLQGLARFSVQGPDQENGMLHKLNFLSTVSGGGYIGSWFMAWARRHPKGYPGVIKEISTCGSTGVDTEVRPLRHLREYTSFLAPQLGGLTVDTWTLVATVMRNLFLNNCMLLPGAAALMCVPILVGFLMLLVSRCWPSQYWIAGLVTALTVALVLLTLIQRISKKWNWVKTAKVLLIVAHGLVSISVGGLVVYGMLIPALDRQLEFTLNTFLEFAGYIAVPLLVPAVYGSWLIIENALEREKAVKAQNPQNVEPSEGFLHRILKRARRIFRCWRYAVAVVAVALATTALLLLLAWMGPVLKAALSIPRLSLSESLWPRDAAVYVLGLPMVWAVLLTASSLFSGIVAKSDREGNREWWARMKAVHMLLMLGWFVCSLIAYYGPALFNWIIGLLTLGAGAISAFAGKSPITPAQVGKAVKSRLALIAPVFGILFLFLLAITLAALNHAAVCMVQGKYPATSEGALWLIYASALISFSLLCNLFFNVNIFSLHEMYRSRLMRAYLGASNEFRNPDFFTNFDPDDNLKESDLLLKDGRPLHIINATLNLVATTNTAWTQRKAESFTFSPLHCGSFRVGYVKTEKYAGSEGITLATAMAISGAAFNPNMGYHSSPLLALIMTLFNVRLGVWLPNPKSDQPDSFFQNSSPRLALAPLVSEALGKTNDSGNFIQVSDGGHFENLAIYEMVMRRCHRIIVVDGGSDPKFQFEDLGNAIRKIRIDLGIHIEFRDENRIKSGNNTQALYCAIADIRYKEVDGPDKPVEDGVLIYWKPSVHRTEALDVQNYATTHPDFPNQTTADQFFNESQFESYRKLGNTMVLEVTACVPDKAYSIDELFTAAENYRANAEFRPDSPSQAVHELSTFLESGKTKITLGDS